MWRPYLGAALLWAIYVIAIPVGRAQEISSANEIPIERCDRLPVVRALIGKTEFRFLLDTGATTVLNLQSFSGGKTRDIEVTSWTGTAATSAREVSVKELSIVSRTSRALETRSGIPMNTSSKLRKHEGQATEWRCAGKRMDAGVS
jgi:hypothetical protein